MKLSEWLKALEASGIRPTRNYRTKGLFSTNAVSFRGEADGAWMRIVIQSWFQIFLGEDNDDSIMLSRFKAKDGKLALERLES
jgi:hypothetical protein